MLLFVEMRHQNASGMSTLTEKKNALFVTTKDFWSAECHLFLVK